MKQIGFFKYCHWEITLFVSEDRSTTRILSQDVYPDDPRRNMTHADVTFDGVNALGRGKHNFEAMVKDAMSRHTQAMVNGYAEFGSER